jgi:hypothetical protein
MKSDQGPIEVHVKPGSRAPGLSIGPDAAIVVRVPRSEVSLVRGAGSRHKAFAIDGFSADEVRRLIGMSAPAQPKTR